MAELKVKVKDKEGRAGQFFHRGEWLDDGPEVEGNDESLSAIATRLHAENTWLRHKWGITEIKVHDLEKRIAMLEGKASKLTAELMRKQ